MEEMKEIAGYRRRDGKIGIRNHVLIIAVDDLSNAVVESVAKAIPGTLPLAHPYGRLQFGADLDLFFRTMIGTGANPNVAAAVVIGISQEPSAQELTRQPPSPLARLARRVLRVYVRRPDPAEIPDQHRGEPSHR